MTWRKSIIFSALIPLLVEKEKKKKKDNKMCTSLLVFNEIIHIKQLKQCGSGAPVAFQFSILTVIIIS